LRASGRPPGRHQITLPEHLVPGELKVGEGDQELSQSLREGGRTRRVFANTPVVDDVGVHQRRESGFAPGTPDRGEPAAHQRLVLFDGRRRAWRRGRPGGGGCVFGPHLGIDADDDTEAQEKRGEDRDENRESRRGEP
jgi:hypothetical protein